AWTTERTFPVAWEITAKNVPPGTAMFRLAPHDLLRPAGTGAALGVRRELSVKDGAAAVEDLLRRTDAAGAPPGDHPGAGLEGVFRGQPVRDTTPINIYRAPDTVAYYTPPAREAKVEVRSEAHMGHLAILLDCSGSMGPRDPKNPRRYDQALAVLR